MENKLRDLATTPHQSSPQLGKSMQDDYKSNKVRKAHKYRGSDNKAGTSSELFTDGD
jgi:hypothetical protein